MRLGHQLAVLAPRASTSSSYALRTARASASTERARTIIGSFEASIAAFGRPRTAPCGPSRRSSFVPFTSARGELLRRLLARAPSSRTGRPRRAPRGACAGANAERHLLELVVDGHRLARTAAARSAGSRASVYSRSRSVVGLRQLLGGAHQRARVREQLRVEARPRLDQPVVAGRAAVCARAALAIPLPRAGRTSPSASGRLAIFAPERLVLRGDLRLEERRVRQRLVPARSAFRPFSTLTQPALGCSGAAPALAAGTREHPAQLGEAMRVRSGSATSRWNASCATVCDALGAAGVTRDEDELALLHAAPSPSAGSAASSPACRRS